MIKALFLDYTGTVIQHRGEDFTELVNRIVKNSDLKNTEEVISWWHENAEEMERSCTPDQFLSQHEIAEKMFEKAEKELHLKDDRTQLITLLQNYLMYAPVFDDVRELFDLGKVPVYIVTDCSEDCVRVCTRRHNLHPYGIISSETVRTYMPGEAVYDYAAKTAGYDKAEIMFISRDLTALQGAQDAGMMTALIDRKSRHRDANVRRFRSLVEVLAHLDK